MQRTVGAMIKRNSVAVVTWLLALLTLLAQPIDGAPAAVRASAQHAAGGTVRITGLLARPTTALAGSSVILQTAVAAQTAFRALIVSIEVYGPTWKSVYAIRASVDIAAQGSRSVAASWSIPSSEATGTYHALVNVFSGDWTIHYAERCCIDLHVTNASGAIALGAWVPGADSNPAVIDQYARLTGRYPAIVNYYQSWLPPNPRDLNLGLLREYERRGITPMISWEPDVPDEKIIGGSYDSFIRRYALDAATFGKTILLRFAWEENGSWTAWSPGVNGNTALTFIAAWRHIHDIFVGEHATNVQWVWAPNVVFPGSAPYSGLYPGDDYVDWLGLDGYNWGTSTTYSYWSSGDQIFGPSIESLMALSSKPIMISEIGSAEQGGNKATWITDWFLRDLPTSFPRVRAVVWFDQNKEADWQIDSSASSLAAFRQVVASPLYQGRLP